MKPKRIILVRHGESEGNADWSVYEKIQNHNVQLTKAGIDQAILVGKDLRKIIKKESIQFYVSPYRRTRQTFNSMIINFRENNYKYIEEPRIREQDTGHYRDKYLYIQNKKSMENFGKFYYRFKDGESGADVYDRVSTFLETMHRDFKKKDFPQNVIIVTHGLTTKLFLMRWFHLTIEEYESAENLRNCEYVIMKKFSDNRYDICGGTYKANIPDRKTRFGLLIELAVTRE